MKSLFLFFALVAGAVGQTAKSIPLTIFHDCKVVAASVGTGTHYWESYTCAEGDVGITSAPRKIEPVALKPDPVDVPAIKKKEKSSTKGMWLCPESCTCSGDSRDSHSPPWAMSCNNQNLTSYPRWVGDEIDKWSCADPTRFLLQSVDGKWHCLKLSPSTIIAPPAP